MARFPAAKRKGIFCIEGLWEGNLNKEPSVRSLLSMLKETRNIPFIHRTAATAAEFDYWLRRFRRRSSFPILYVASHGAKGSVYFDEDVQLSRITEVLEAGCQDAVIHLGSCRTILAKDSCRDLIQRSGALAVT